MAPHSNSGRVRLLVLTVLGAALGVVGVYVGETDDAPGAALLGLVLMVAVFVYGVRCFRRNASK